MSIRNGAEAAVKAMHELTVSGTSRSWLLGLANARRQFDAFDVKVEVIIQ
ncbi:MAG: hypothetical protein KJ852_16545 [Gammaproteobacteria bacterium]|nr:hypothetical protein [Gammaproteobacteria bacterium]MBU0786832.1 hypothetical protein [Gammaproteobacteria bacterium]MBU0813962.1 hypothetical protein [Gammaproteobacteria bacterium]MBU1788565.1 hypothetical protein [Gammaproteobacteria bacterium]